MISEKYMKSKEYLLTYCLLIQAAQHRGKVTYQEIAAMVGLPLKGSHMSSEVGNLIGAVSENEVDKGRPMLSAIVVGVSGKPGAGLFTWAKQLGRFDPSTQSEDEFWAAECEAVYETWKKAFKS